MLRGSWVWLPGGREQLLCRCSVPGITPRQGEELSGEVWRGRWQKARWEGHVVLSAHCDFASSSCSLKCRQGFQVLNCILSNSSPITAACSCNHPRIRNKNVWSEAGSALASADSISPLGARVPVVHWLCLTPGHSGALADHKHISIFLSFLLITLYPKKTKNKTREVGGCRGACLCGSAGWAGWQRRRCWQRGRCDLRPAYGIDRWAGTGAQELQPLLKLLLLLSSAQCKGGLGWGVLVNQR